MVPQLWACAATHSSNTAGASPPAVVLQSRTTVELYEERRPARLVGLEGQVLALLQEIAAGSGQPALTAEEGTQGAAREICRGLLPDGPPPAALVDFALRNNGLVDPPPHFVIAAVPPGSEAGLLEQLGPRFGSIIQKGSFTRVGIGLDEPARMPGQRRLVVALFQSNTLFRPFRRLMTSGALEPLEFTVRPGYSDISMVVTDPAGKIGPHPCSRRGARYRASLRCAARGVYQVEVMGEGKHGPEVLANFPIYCDQPPPRTLRYSAPPPLPERLSDLEQEIFRRTNQLRQKRGLPLLRPDATLDEATRRHSLDMRDAGFVGHRSPTTGDPADRLDRAGITYVVVRENVARGYSAEEIMTELMKSPAHRENILSRDVSVLGVGVALDRRNHSPVILLTQNFIAPGERYDPATAPDRVLLLVEKTRKALGLHRLKRDPDLSRLAERYVAAVIMAGGAQADADRDLERALKKLGPHFQRVEGVMVRVSVIDSLSQAEELKRKRTTHVGVGVGQLDKQLVIFVLQGTSR